MARKTKAQQWARKTPAERVKLYRDMAAHLREVATELGSGAAPGEAMALGLAARQFTGIAGHVQNQIELETRPTCCPSARMFGSCDGHPDEVAA